MMGLKLREIVNAEMVFNDAKACKYTEWNKAPHNTVNETVYCVEGRHNSNRGNIMRVLPVEL